MPVAYRIDKTLGTVFSIGTGVVTDEELLDHQRTLAQDPDFRPDMRQLADATGITDVQATARGVLKLTLGNPFGQGAKRAFVTSDEAVARLARMFEKGRIRPEDEFRVFPSLSEAREWLELPPDAGYNP